MVLIRYVIIINSFLATGDSYTTLAGRFRVGITTVHRCIKKTCKSIWDILPGSYMKPPTKQDWISIEQNFYKQWNFPNCVGAVDGKHIVIQAPHNSGSQFFNYKGTFSLVLMAWVDADYRFVFVDIGDYGSQSDGAVFKNSHLGQQFINGQLDIPGPKALPYYPQGGVLPHCLVGDETFPCRMDLMHPYPRGSKQNRLAWPERIFNYRLSRARHISENAFGILVQRWRLFNRRIALLPENVDLIVMACVVLHNFLAECEVRRPVSPYYFHFRCIVDLVVPLVYYSGCVDRSGSLSSSAFNQLKLVTLSIVLTILYLLKTVLQRSLLQCLNSLYKSDEVF